MWKIRNHSKTHDRGFLGFDVWIEPGVNEVDARVFNLLTRNCPRFQDAMDTEGAVAGGEPMIKVLGKRGPEGEARIKSNFRERVRFNAPELVVPKQGTTELNDTQYIKLMGWETYVKQVGTPDESLRKLAGTAPNPRFMALLKEGELAFES